MKPFRFTRRFSRAAPLARLKKLVRPLAQLTTHLTQPLSMTVTKRLSRQSEKVSSIVERSPYLSRDLSWLAFNERVLDQARDPQRNLFERMKFLAITASNLDEFFTIRVGSLYNYLDLRKERIDYSGLREGPFKQYLLQEIHRFYEERNAVFEQSILPLFAENELLLARWDDLTEAEAQAAQQYFEHTLFPLLTPMVYDQTHAFPSLRPRTLTLAVVTRNTDDLNRKDRQERKLSFVQIPQNLPRFYTIERRNEVVFLPTEEIVRHEMQALYRNVEILDISLLRIIRNGDFTLEDIDDVDEDFVDEIRQKVNSRRLGRVVKLVTESSCPEWVMELLLKRFDLSTQNVFFNDRFIDYTGFWQILRHPEFSDEMKLPPTPVLPLHLRPGQMDNIFEAIAEHDIFLHHPYNSFEPVLQLLEQAAEDPGVLSIKLTIYRLAKKSRVTKALLRAAENGKNVAVLFEVKARFDEENNIREAERLQKAGCYVIYGIGRFKTHTKLLLVVRSEASGVRRYAHLSSGNYNEETAKLYTDVGLLTAQEAYTHDVSEFFNVITGHSIPSSYQNLITAPRDMRNRLLDLIAHEAENAQLGRPSGIFLKINSLEDRILIDALYGASEAGVPIKLIVRGICCLRPGREGLSENIQVRSLVGDFLEHTRLLYFHNGGEPRVFAGSADIMVRSFDKRIESIFELLDPAVRQQAIQILDYNLRDNVTAYELQQDGSFVKVPVPAGQEPFNIHKVFFEVNLNNLWESKLF